MFSADARDRDDDDAPEPVDVEPSSSLQTTCSDPAPPSELSGDEAATAEWLRLAPMVGEADRTALLVLCQQWSRYHEATSKVSKAGLVVRSQTGQPIPNPYITVADKALAMCLKLWAELGLESERDPTTGRFLLANGVAVTHGERRNLDRPDLAETVERQRVELEQQVGAPLTPTMARLVLSTARASVLEESAWNAMVTAGGPVTGKGRRRAIFDVWDRLDEKLARRVEKLGLARAERNVTNMSAAEWVAAHPSDHEPEKE